MGTLTFGDIFKTSFLTTALQDLTLGRILMTLGITFVIGIFLYFVYKRTFRGVLYSRSFNLSLIAITLVTAVVIMAVTSNLVLSLGMVGALSIVRFRTAVKDSMDLVFLFWSLVVGIVTGAGLHMLAVLGSLVIGLVLFVLHLMPVGDTPYLLVVQAANGEADAGVRGALAGARHQFKVKSKTMSPIGVEATYEIRLKDDATGLVNEIAGLEGVQNAVLIAYNGDYVT